MYKHMKRALPITVVSLLSAVGCSNGEIGESAPGNAAANPTEIASKNGSNLDSTGDQSELQQDSTGNLPELRQDESGHYYSIWPDYISPYPDYQGEIETAPRTKGMTDVLLEYANEALDSVNQINTVLSDVKQLCSGFAAGEACLIQAGTLTLPAESEVWLANSELTFVSYSGTDSDGFDYSMDVMHTADDGSVSSENYSWNTEQTMVSSSSSSTNNIGEMGSSDSEVDEDGYGILTEYSYDQNKSVSFNVTDLSQFVFSMTDEHFSDFNEHKMTWLLKNDDVRNGIALQENSTDSSTWEGIQYNGVQEANHFADNEGAEIQTTFQTENGGTPVVGREREVHLVNGLVTIESCKVGPDSPCNFTDDSGWTDVTDMVRLPPSELPPSEQDQNGGTTTGSGSGGERTAGTTGG